jgi:hypothetical protein
MNQREHQQRAEEEGRASVLYGFFGSVTRGSFSFSFSASTLKRL